MSTTAPLDQSRQTADLLHNSQFAIEKITANGGYRPTALNAITLQHDVIGAALAWLPIVIQNVEGKLFLLAIKVE